MASSTATRPPVNRKSRPLSVSLVLSIDGTAYDVSPRPPAPGGSRSFRLAKHAAGEACYDVAAFADRITCTCPSYTKTHEGTCSTCKHGTALVLVGLLETGAVAPPPADTGCGIAPAYGDRVRHVSLPGVWRVVSAPPLSDAIRVRELDAHGAMIGKTLTWIVTELAPVALEPEPCTACVPAVEPEVEPVEVEERRLHTFPADADGTDWDDDHTWNLGPAGDVVDPRTWDESLDGEDDDTWTTTDLIPAAADSGPVARPLAEQLADRIAGLRSEGTPLADLMADHLEGLAGEVHATEATTVEQFRDRREALRASVA